MSSAWPGTCLPFEAQRPTQNTRSRATERETHSWHCQQPALPTASTRLATDSLPYAPPEPPAVPSLKKTWPSLFPRVRSGCWPAAVLCCDGRRSEHGACIDSAVYAYTPVRRRHAAVCGCGLLQRRQVEAFEGELITQLVQCHCGCVPSKTESNNRPG